jgi:2,4-dienoyl-CoA reductase-like NADH-dependent reductase (Old Yellow Enzyme family)
MSAVTTPEPLLFQPLTLRGLRLSNPIVISPMCQHAAERGHATAWHLVHLGKFVRGGAGLILTESTAVDPRGRIGTADPDLWNDAQIAPLRAVVDFVHTNGGAIGVQLAHAGRKAGSQALWNGGAALTETQLAADEEPWQRFGPSALAAGPGWSASAVLEAGGIEAIAQRFVDATERAERAGFDVLALHFGHGYLVANFLSPNANQRSDEWGGSLASRMRLARAPKVWGVDVIDCSSGGLTEETRALPVPRGRGFQVPFSARIRREAQIVTQAVGMIVDAAQAEAVLASGQADLVALGREALSNPYRPHHAAATLGADPGFARWPLRHGVWPAKRAPGLAAARAGAGTPAAATDVTAT